MKTSLRRASVLLLILLASVGGAAAQTNIAILGGAVAITAEGDSDRVHWGRAFGSIVKFNISPIIRIRGQLNVDKSQMVGVVSGDFRGDQSLTAVSLGFGAEAAFGNRDIDLFINATPHGTIRTLFRTTTDNDGNIRVGDLTRFSLGFTAGLGAEVFITNNIGFEAQMQYSIYNFDQNETDPRHSGVRVTGGIQFYLGRNFAR